MEWYTWMFSGVGVAAAAALGRLLFQRRGRTSPTVRISQRQHGRGNVQIAGDVSVSITRSSSSVRSQALPLRDLAERIKRMQELASEMGDPNLRLTFVSHQWGFSADLEVPDRAICKAIAYTIVEGLGLDRRLRIRSVLDTVEITWLLATADGRVLNPNLSLRGAGLRSGDVVHLHVTVEPIRVMYWRSARAAMLAQIRPDVVSSYDGASNNGEQWIA